MTYTKPEVVLSESALAAVQSGSTGKGLGSPDSNLHPQPSDAAYEADE
jgi:hypothetical protein